MDTELVLGNKTVSKKQTHSWTSHSSQSGDKGSKYIISSVINSKKKR